MDLSTLPKSEIDPDLVDSEFCPFCFGTGMDETGDSNPGGWTVDCRFCDASAKAWREN